MNQEILYDDYRAENGVQLPHKIELHRGARCYSIDVTRAAVNEPVGERVFDFPRKSQVQLPDLKALFKQIDANQQAVDKIKENYAGTKVEEETGLRRQRQTEKARRPRIHFLLPRRHRSLDAGENQWPAPQRGSPEKRKRSRPEAD